MGNMGNMGNMGVLFRLNLVWCLTTGKLIERWESKSPQLGCSVCMGPGIRMGLGVHKGHGEIPFLNLVKGVS
jgi:hypothetical protein